MMLRNYSESSGNILLSLLERLCCELRLWEQIKQEQRWPQARRMLRRSEEWIPGFVTNSHTKTLQQDTLVSKEMAEASNQGTCICNLVELISLY